jgi:hypothetical protein
MYMHNPRIRICGHRKPVDSVLDVGIQSGQSEETVLIVATGATDNIDKALIQVIVAIRMCLRGAHGLVQGLKDQPLALRLEPVRNLCPQLLELGKFRIQVGVDGEVGPLPTVVVDIYHHPELPRKRPVYNLLHPIHPGGVHGVIRGLGREMVRPCYGDPDGLDASGFDRVEECFRYCGRALSSPGPIRLSVHKPRGFLCPHEQATPALVVVDKPP